MSAPPRWALSVHRATWVCLAGLAIGWMAGDALLPHAAFWSGVTTIIAIATLVVAGWALARHRHRLAQLDLLEEVRRTIPLVTSYSIVSVGIVLAGVFGSIWIGPLAAVAVAVGLHGTINMAVDLWYDVELLHSSSDNTPAPRHRVGARHRNT